MSSSLGKRVYYSNTRMVDVLGIEPTSMRSTVVDMAYSLIDRGIISKK